MHRSRSAVFRGLGAASLFVSLLAIGASDARAATFTDLVLQNGWTNAPLATRNARVSYVSGIVHFSGAIANGSSPLAFTLPTGIRPATNVYVPVDLCGAAHGRLLILPSGDVNIQTEGAFSDAQCMTSLEGASFAPFATSFTALALVNGWTTTPYSTSDPAVTIETPFGATGSVVHFRGAIANGTSALAFTLPSGYRPTTTVYAPVDLCGATHGRLVIEPSGDVSVQAEGGAFTRAQCFTSLDGAWFAQNAGALTLTNNWTTTPYGTGAPSVEDIGGILYLKGAIANGTSALAFTLPTGFRPATNVYVPVDLCGATKGDLLIQPSGAVTVEAAGGTFFNAQCFTSLDGVSFANSTSATVDVFNAHFPVGELHSVQGANQAGSFAAAAMMGGEGFSSAFPPVNWDSMITSSCTAHTGSSLWPSSCNPTGMAAAVGAFTVNDWTTRTWAATDEASALIETLASLKFYQSPAVVPIFGQADHWVTITQITATLTGTGWNINQVKAYDGGPPGLADSGFNNYTSGLQAWGGNAWANVYFKVLTAINPACDPNCTSDPFFNQYVLMYEPPHGHSHPAISAVFSKAPGIVAARSHAMTEHLARMQVWKALTAAGIDADPEIWNAIRGGVPGTAFEVNGVFPSGSPWNYYLVPIFASASTNTAIAFVQLAMDDGSFEGIHVPTRPVPFHPMTMSQAEHLVQGGLAKGESLTEGTLTWDPRSDAQLAKSPVHPYYEFGVVSAANTSAGVVRVALDGGAVARGQ